jgi:hypothetical protein
MGEELRRGGAWGEMGKGERGAAGKKGDAGALAREARRAEAEHTQRAQATGRVLSTSACARLRERQSSYMYELKTQESGPGWAHL